ncbi:MAG: sulfatase-like hydrolase/transferase, partial [Acidobacteriaceae bacterium]
TVKMFRGGMALLGICIVWMLPQLIHMAAHSEPHDVRSFARPVSSAQPPQRRVIWILFDELSQDQTFDHRQPGMSLPQLDRFRSQSVMFSDVQPAGYFTELVLPSLLWGHVATAERSDLSGNLSVKRAGQWQLYPPGETVFADAQRGGWSTGLAGWYNPYCRTYGAYLDWCAWAMRWSEIPGKYEQGQSLGWNANAPLMRAEATLTGRRNPTPLMVENHTEDYRDLMRWSHELIDDGNIGFVFLHLPLPHPGGFYNRKTGQIGVHGSYLDNLALTDRTLGELMQWISQTPLASQTTVIVCSDHSWRVPLWSRTSAWTKEDEEASGGRFDPRPVLMVHFPGETTPAVVGKPFAAIREHDLVESLLHGAMTPEALQGWVRGQ